MGRKPIRRGWVGAKRDEKLPSQCCSDGLELEKGETRTNIYCRVHACNRTTSCKFMPARMHALPAVNIWERPFSTTALLTALRYAFYRRNLAQGARVAHHSHWSSLAIRASALAYSDKLQRNKLMRSYCRDALWFLLRVRTSHTSTCTSLVRSSLLAHLT